MQTANERTVYVEGDAGRQMTKRLTPDTDSDHATSPAIAIDVGMNCGIQARGKGWGRVVEEERNFDQGDVDSSYRTCESGRNCLNSEKKSEVVREINGSEGTTVKNKLIILESSDGRGEVISETHSAVNGRDMSGSDVIPQTNGETNEVRILPVCQVLNSGCIADDDSTQVSLRADVEKYVGNDICPTDNSNSLAEESNQRSSSSEVTVCLCSRKLRALPGWGTLTPSTTQLLLDHNSLPDLPPDFCRALPALTVLSLTGNDLERLPDSVAELCFLRELRVDENRLSALPEGVASLRHLQVLSVSGNELTRLPLELGRLAALTTISAYENRLRTLPDTFGMLGVLVTLELGENVLERLPRNFGALRSLRTLNLSHNRLSDVEHLATLPSLEVLDISHNRVVTLPARLRSASHLRQLHATDNHIVQLPGWTRELWALEVLALENNCITEEPFPDDFGDVCRSLRELTLGANSIQALPSSLGRLSSLERLHIGSTMCELERRNFQNGNWLSRLPANFASLAALTYACLNENQISALPRNFGDLVNLEWLDLGQNQLRDLPDSFGSLRSLSFCQLSKNHLELLPSTFGCLSNLDDLRLDSNVLSELPESFACLTQLKTLDLYTNRLTVLPPYLYTFTNLRRLDLANNRFSIPEIEEPRIVRTSKYAQRDPSLKDNWRGRHRADGRDFTPFTIEAANAVNAGLHTVTVDSVCQADLAAAAPLAGSSVLARAMKAGASIWRSHAASQSERGTANNRVGSAGQGESDGDESELSSVDPVDSAAQNADALLAQGGSKSAEPVEDWDRDIAEAEAAATLSQSPVFGSNGLVPSIYNDRSLTPCHIPATPIRVSGRVDRAGLIWCRTYTPSFYFLPAASHPPSISRALQASRAATGGGYQLPQHPYQRPELTDLLWSAAHGQFEDVD